NSEAKALISEDSFHEKIDSIRNELNYLDYYITLSNLDTGWVSYDKLLTESTDADIPDIHVELNDMHRLMYTSGTTSRPKGVIISYENLYWKNIGHIWNFDIDQYDKTLIVGPLYHVGAMDL